MVGFRHRDISRFQNRRGNICNVMILATDLAFAFDPLRPMHHQGIVLTARCAGLVGHLFEEMREPAAPAMWQGAQDSVTYEP